jgi:hypothetical protein
MNWSLCGKVRNRPPLNQGGRLIASHCDRSRALDRLSIALILEKRTTLSQTSLMPKTRLHLSLNDQYGIGNINAHYIWPVELIITQVSAQIRS